MKTSGLGSMQKTLSPSWKALTIKPKYLSQILTGNKMWEIRKVNCHYRGTVVLVASATHKVWGTATLTASVYKSRGELQAGSGLTEAELDSFCGPNGAYAWMLEKPVLLAKPVDWKPVPHCIIWSPVSQTLELKLRLAASRYNVPVDELLVEMKTAESQVKLERVKRRRNQNKLKLKKSGRQHS